ncbi:hypothetical protein [Bifidobacterium leontopitheci]|uniref:Uncharacterized protein n=1 Tax=Bifidobacterium leontopitheci TaxID=2650774 RepID=A0A6I1GVK9_9BIFI|nr:hypothetical protein [Bifidobacterium leontopitheci]KAB7790491.1 hypothetical protein F7D09_0987 [Bifidobacterium leontopitheci]
MDISKNWRFGEVPTGVDRMYAKIHIGHPNNATGIEKMIHARTAETPLDFSVMYYRFPRQAADGTWSNRSMERFEYTDLSGCRVRDERYPKRLQFNLRFLQYRLSAGLIRPLMKVEFRDAFDGMEDSPVVTRIAKLWDVLDLETLRRDNLLTDDMDESLRGGYALVEHTTGIVLPACPGATIEFIVDGGEDAMMIRVTPTNRSMPTLPTDDAPSSTGYERYDTPDGIDERRLQADIERWSADLEQQIGIRDSPQFDRERKVIERLRAITAEEDSWND